MLNLVSAVIKPHRLENVKDALQDAGVAGMTVAEVRGFGRQRGHTESFRGSEYTVDFVPKVQVTVLCETGDADKIAELIAASAATGTIGDGKVWVQPLDRLIRVRTGERDTDAL
ncbi:MAG: P-II family nitrogen regulator [Acidimicrobiia bacterium]